jgi:hypothetical protein
LPESCYRGTLRPRNRVPEQSFTLIVSDIRLLTNADRCQLQASVNSDALDEPFLLWYRFPLGYEQFIRPENGNPFVSALLLPAMRAGEALAIEAPVSPKLLRSTREIQKIYRSWDSGLSEVAIDAPIATGNAPLTDTDQGIGLFVSLGVDSSYSLVKNLRDHPADDESIGHLLHVHGLDICVRNDDNGILQEIRKYARTLTRRFGKELIIIDTNIRDIMDRFVDWSLLGHGAGLASVGHVLEAGLRRIHIAAGPTYQNPRPCGSHPMLDPLWSTEGLSFCYDGAEATRREKIEVLAQWPVVLETLRVCYQDPPEAYNCGACWKCLSTMIRLDIVGALRKCRTLPQQVDLDRVRKVRADPLLEASSYKSLLEEVRSAGGDPSLVAVLESRLDEALARRPASVAEIDRLQAEAALLNPLRAELARLRAGLKKQVAWARQSAQEVTRRDAIIVGLQRQLQEQTAWAMRSAEEVRERDGMIRELQEQLRVQTAWAQRSAEAVLERDRIIRGLQAQLAGREAADDPAASRQMVQRPG